MNVAVYGLWHLGCVTAACLAAKKHRVIGIDPDKAIIEALGVGRPPVAEPGLADELKDGVAGGFLMFSSDMTEISRSDVLWVTFDTPVDSQDRADVEFVVGKIRNTFPFLMDDAVILISSQLPVGTTARIEAEAGLIRKKLHIAYSPENLRLGSAMRVFSNPDRIVVGTRSERARLRIRELLAPVSERIIWMSPESAEMSKHAVNAFLAMSVVFANELAVLCESAGADAKDVELALKSEHRIGNEAYLAPGPAFAGGTLARDVAFLEQLGSAHGLDTQLISAISLSNDQHKKWVYRKITSVIDRKRDVRIAVWGLTYKPGTDTLRRSSSVELCVWLRENGCSVYAHDPAFLKAPEEINGVADFGTDPVDICKGCDVLVIATSWPLYREIKACDVVSAMRRGAVVIDAARFLRSTLGNHEDIKYLSVGGTA